MKPYHLISLVGISAICGSTLLGTAHQAQAASIGVNNVVVDTELAFLIDASDSIGSGALNVDQQFQAVITAHGNLFKTPTFFHDFIAPLPNQKIAVSLYQFAKGVDRSIEWTLIENQSQATAFGDRVLKLQRTLDGNFTDIGLAIEKAGNDISTNSFTGIYRTLDLASDGIENAYGSSPYAVMALHELFQGDKIDVLNSIAVLQSSSSILPQLKLVSDFNGGSNPNNNSAMIFEAGALNNYAPLFGQKVAFETRGTYLPPTLSPASSIPEPSSTGGVVFIGLGILGAFAQRRGQLR